MPVETKRGGSHAGSAKLQFWLSFAELAKLDKILRERGYPNRAEWFRDMARRTIRET